MARALIEAAFIIGFLAVWLGLALFIFTINIRFFLGGSFLKSLTMRYSGRAAIASLFLNEEFQRFWRSRAGWVSQVLLAFGSGVLILVGIVWIVLRIVEKQAGTG